MHRTSVLQKIEPAAALAPWPGGSSVATVDAARCARLQDLEKSSWEDFYVAQRRLVAVVLAGSLGYGQGLDDLVQEVFVTAVGLVKSNRCRLHGDGSGLKAWLVAIAIRVAKTELRRRQRARSRLVDQDSSQLPSPLRDPERVQLLRAAQRLLMSFPEKLQVPWILRHLERMTVDEIASALAVSPATVKRRLGKAEDRFQRGARRDPVLCDYLESGVLP